MKRGCEGSVPVACHSDSISGSRIRRRVPATGDRFDTISQATVDEVATMPFAKAVECETC